MIKYTVVEEQGIVIARIKDCESDVFNLIKKKTAIEVDYELVKLRPTYKGVAKCVDGDTFDVEEGKRIAREIAVQKYNIAFNKALAKATDFAYDTYKAISEVEDKFLREF